MCLAAPISGLQIKDRLHFVMKAISMEIQLDLISLTFFLCGNLSSVLILNVHRRVQRL